MTFVEGHWRSICHPSAPGSSAEHVRVAPTPVHDDDPGCVEAAAQLHDRRQVLVWQHDARHGPRTSASHIGWSVMMVAGTSTGPPARRLTRWSTRRCAVVACLTPRPDWSATRLSCRLPSTDGDDDERDGADRPRWPGASRASSRCEPAGASLPSTADHEERHQERPRGVQEGPPACRHREQERRADERQDAARRGAPRAPSAGAVQTNGASPATPIEADARPIGKAGSSKTSREAGPGRRRRGSPAPSPGPGRGTCRRLGRSANAKMSSLRTRTMFSSA